MQANTLSAQQRLETLYRKSARNIARMVLPHSGVLDAGGNTVDDHAANLCAKAWLAQKKFLERGISDANQESRWVHASLWNAARGAEKQRAVRSRLFCNLYPGTEDRIESDTDVEESFYRKEAVNRVRSFLDPQELDLLERYSDCGQNLSATLRSYGSPISLKLLGKLLNGVKERASRVINGDKDFGKISGLEALYKSEESEQMTTNDLPECFGISWEPYGDSACCECGVKHECLDKLAKTVYPNAIQKLKLSGKEATVQNLSIEMEINLEAVTAVQQYASKIPFVASPESTPVPSPEVGEVESPKPPAVAEEVPAAEIPAAETIPEKKEEADPPKTEKKKRGRPRKVSELVPQEAGPVPSAVEPAKIKKGGKKSAKPATERGATSEKKTKKSEKPDANEKRHWGKHTFHTRWLRERERNPLVAALTPGTKVRREYKGVVVEVKVQRGYYTFNGEEYPTLQAATTAATGARSYPKQKMDGKSQRGTRMMGNWSAVKFWKLKEWGRAK